MNNLIASLTRCNDRASRLILRKTYRFLLAQTRKSTAGKKASRKVKAGKVCDTAAPGTPTPSPRRDSTPSSFPTPQRRGWAATPRSTPSPMFRGRCQTPRSPQPGTSRTGILRVAPLPRLSPATSPTSAATTRPPITPRGTAIPTSPASTHYEPTTPRAEAQADIKIEKSSITEWISPKYEVNSPSIQGSLKDPWITEIYSSGKDSVPNSLNLSQYIKNRVDAVKTNLNFSPKDGVATKSESDEVFVSDEDGDNTIQIKVASNMTFRTQAVQLNPNECSIYFEF